MLLNNPYYLLSVAVWNKLGSKTQMRLSGVRDASNQCKCHCIRGYTYSSGCYFNHHFYILHQSVGILTREQYQGATLQTIGLFCALVCLAPGCDSQPDNSSMLCANHLLQVVCYRAVYFLHSLAEHLSVATRAVLQTIFAIAAQPQPIHQVSLMQLLPSAQHRWSDIELI